MVANVIFEKNILKVYPIEEAKIYLNHYYEKIKEINKFLDDEISKNKTGNDRIFFCQRILEMIIDNNRLINFIEITKLNFRKILDDEKSKINLAISIIKKEIEEEYKEELKTIRTKQERENFVNLLLEQNSDINDKKRMLIHLELSDESFWIEKNNLLRIKETLEEFVRVLKKDLL